MHMIAVTAQLQHRHYHHRYHHHYHHHQTTADLWMNAGEHNIHTHRSKIKRAQLRKHARAVSRDMNSTSMPAAVLFGPLTQQVDIHKFSQL